MTMDVNGALYTTQGGWLSRKWPGWGPSPGPDVQARRPAFFTPSLPVSHLSFLPPTVGWASLGKEIKIPNPGDTENNGRTHGSS